MSGSRFKPAITLQDQGLNPGGSETYTGMVGDLILGADGSVISTAAAGTAVSIVEDGTTLARIESNPDGSFTAAVPPA